MQTLIICGTPWCELQPLQALLETSGLGQARQAKAGSIVGIDQWHDRLCLSQSRALSPIQPGKPWELAAGEIFLANWDQPTWSWADSRSTWLLEFWRDFDSSTLFVLLYTPAYDVLTRAMADTGTASFDSQTLLDTWCAYQTELLRFYHRNRARSVLVHAHLVNQPGTQLVQTINDALGTALNPVALVPSNAQAVDPLMHLLVQNILQNHPAVRALEDEISATLPECNAVQPVPVADTASAIAHLRALYGTQVARLQAQHAQNTASAELKQQNELLLLQLHQVQEELDQHFLAKQKLENQIATTLLEHNALVSQNAQRAAQERDNYLSERQRAQEELQRQQLAIENSRVTAEQLNRAQQELKQENELLLLQLHQVQEELEQHFLAKQKLEKQIATTLHEHNALVSQNAQRASQERDIHISERQQAQEELQRQQLVIENSRVTAERLNQAQQELKQENELLLLQLHQVQEELEHHFLAKQKLEDQMATTLHEHNALVSQNAQRASQERDIHISERHQAQEELQRQQLVIENSRVTAEQLNRAQQELKQENELLLLQLHQVQEELEHYFLQHQQATQEKQMVEANLNKLLVQYPDHAEWDRVELLSTTVPLRSLIQGIKVGGLSPRAINLAVDMVDRTPVLVLTPPEQATDQPLRYWPTNQNTGAPDALAPLLLNPLAPPGTESAALLRRLAPSDLQLVRAACAAMAQDLPASQPARDAWVEVIGTLRQQLSQLPPAWRFDTVQLKRQQVNPGYEHLWFELGNVRFGKRHWPTFEFRLSAPDIKKGKFSHLPKLEFPLPLHADKQFENWFDEAQDQADPRFELRFDTKNKAMDIGLWQALSATDQAQALSLCDQLPTLLRRLQAQGVQIARPWEDWQTLASGLQQALARCLGLKSLMGNAA
jgi:hypothetical protein